MRRSVRFAVRPMLWWCVLSFVCVMPAVALACQDAPNPSNFEHYFSADSQLLPNGMMVLKYHDDTDERVTHVTIHRVLRSMPGRQAALPEWRDPQVTVLESDGTIGPITYLIKAHALYYGVGVDSLGFPKKAWIDPEEDGLNGNEHRAGNFG